MRRCPAGLAECKMFAVGQGQDGSDVDLHMYQLDPGNACSICGDITDHYGHAHNDIVTHCLCNAHHVDDVLLRPEERDLVQKLGEIAESFHALCFGIGCDAGLATDDWNEIVSTIHELQRTVMSQVAARCYPQLFRPLGGARGTLR